MELLYEALHVPVRFAWLSSRTNVALMIRRPKNGQVVVSLNYCSQNGGNLYRAPYYNGNPNRGPRIIGNLDQYPSTLSTLDGFGRPGSLWEPLQGMPSLEFKMLEPQREASGRSRTSTY